MSSNAARRNARTDLGYGCGESILLWERRYKPAKIVGVTSMQGHCRVAKDALGSADDVSLDTEIDLQVGDAVSWTQDLASKGDAVFDRIIALDCAYQCVKASRRCNDGRPFSESDDLFPLPPLSTPPSPPFSTASTLGTRFSRVPSRSWTLSGEPSA